MAKNTNLKTKKKPTKAKATKATTKAELSRLFSDFAGDVSKAFTPAPQMPSLDFVEKYRVLTTAESATQGPYSSAPTPFVMAWHAALDSPAVSQVTIVAPAQTGKTTFLQNVLMSQIALHPQPMMFLFPTLEMAKIFSRGRLRAVFNNSIMRSLVNKKNNVTVNMSQVSFRGGSLILCGSNNVAALSSHPIATLYADEVDRLTPDSSEGQPLELAKARTRSFFSRKILLTSTPTCAKTSQIAKEFFQGSQEHYCFPCPACGQFSEPSFSLLGEYVWDADAQRVRGELSMACAHCGAMISEGDFRRLLMAGGFKWIPAAPQVKDHRSFWLSGFVSPFVPWAEIVKKYEQSKGDLNKTKVFKNTVLAELYDGPEVDREKIESFTSACANFGAGVDFPEGVETLVAGVDTQDRYLRYVVWGYGKSCGLVCVESGKIDGVPSDASTFEAFLFFTRRKWKGPGEKLMPLSLVAVDAMGHFSGSWYEYAYRLRRSVAPKIIIIKGASDENAPAIKRPPTFVQVDAHSTRKAELFLLGVSALKTKLYHALDAEAVVFSAASDAGLTQDFFDELLSEVPEYIDGKMKWRKIHKRNEGLDCSVYALAAFEFLGVKVKTKKPETLPKPTPANPEPPTNETKEPPPPPPQPRRRRFSGDWGGGVGFGGGGWGL